MDDARPAGRDAENRLMGLLSYAAEYGDLSRCLARECADMASYLALCVLPGDAMRPGEGIEWHPHVDLMRERQAWPGEDDGRVLAHVLGWRVERARMVLDELRRIGLIAWDGTRTHVKHIRLLLQDGRPVEREGIVYDFRTKRPVRRRRTVKVRATDV